MSSIKYALIQYCSRFLSPLHESCTRKALLDSSLHHIPDNDYWGICLFHVVWTIFFGNYSYVVHTEYIFFFFINWTVRMTDNLPDRVQIWGHVHIICITVRENRIIYCQIFCDLLKKKIYIPCVPHKNNCQKKLFTRHETDRFLNNHCQECVRAYEASMIVTFLHEAMIGNHFWVKNMFAWNSNLEYGGIFTKLFTHVLSRNMFPTTRNRQIRVHVYRPRHCCGDFRMFLSPDFEFNFLTISP
jgi:hypothetical protein